MKKLLLCLSALFLLLPVCRTAALADAVAWDASPADYSVWVSAPDGGVNFRTGPGTEYEKLQSAMIPNGTKLNITSTSDGWGETQYGGQDGWVALSQTTTKAPAATAAPAAAPAQTSAAAQTAAPATASASTSPAGTLPAVQSASPDAASPDVSASPADLAVPGTVSGVNLFVVGLLVAVIVVLAVVLIVVLRKKRGGK